jgi:5-methylcytosine-specific restriction endonuclease McrA
MKRFIYNKLGAGKIIEQYSICENPTPGTFGDYILMKYNLRELDDDEPYKKRILLSNNYLKYIRKKFGELHCEKCGLNNLRIKRVKTKAHNKMATIDHWFPISKFENLQDKFANLRVMCVKCNTKKGNKIIKKEDLKFSYPEEDRI